MDEQAQTDEQLVRRLNEKFYEALSHQSFEEMARVWSHGSEVRCIHPGWDVLFGWRAISEAWRSIFAAGAGLGVAAQDVEIAVHGSMAWVGCLERITNSAAGQQQVSLARATNLFVRHESGWKMVLHHASPVPAEFDSTESGAVH